jgi:hypothetical protein
MQEENICFVVMPFGIKPKNDGSGGSYNFDKVYRVIIQRAISNLNMKPLRADETEGSRIIHADMFKDLRDRPVVLVDLSLLNPNVFYELGIRHVMSPTGTVLMANEETVKRLPFDIALSRTIPYKYDGEYLDWDEVERVVPQLQAAIEEARRGEPDSPVYAFLEQVLSPHTIKKEEELPQEDENYYDELDDYQAQFAKIWLSQDQISFDKLIEEHNNSSFGVRALGYYAYDAEICWEKKKEIAELLYNHEEYDLATKLYKILDDAGKLGFEDLMQYGSAASLATLTIRSAQQGVKLVEKARQIAQSNLDRDPSNKQFKLDVSYATQRYANMLARVWNRSKDEKDLERVIHDLRDSIRMIEELREQGEFVPTWRYAHNLLRLAMFLRVAENDRNRYDLENNFQKVLALKHNNDESYNSKSYLRWYQIFVLADMGKYDDAQKRAVNAIREDTKYAEKNQNSEIGRTQYSELRRFLELFSRYWRDTKAIGRVSQIINSARFR